MTSGNSRSITTNQSGVHEKIPELVKRHLANTSQKPFNQHTLAAFSQVKDWLNDQSVDRPLIFDSCCGVGESTARIATRHPDALVIGIDKSAQRTQKHQHYAGAQSNYLVVRADVNDFWRLALDSGMSLYKHYLLYPNPYPKSAQVQRRWHASSAFKALIQLGGILEVRSNWSIYIEEFALALNITGVDATAEPCQHSEPDTPFERKYWASGQTNWQLVCQLK